MTMMGARDKCHLHLCGPTWTSPNSMPRRQIRPELHRGRRRTTKLRSTFPKPRREGRLRRTVVRVRTGARRSPSATALLRLERFACFLRFACHRRAHPTTPSRQWSPQGRKSTQCRTLRILRSMLGLHIPRFHPCLLLAVHAPMTTRTTTPSLSLRAPVRGNTDAREMVDRALVFRAVKVGTCLPVSGEGIKILIRRMRLSSILLSLTAMFPRPRCAA